MARLGSEMRNMNCVAAVGLVNPNKQLVPDPASEIMVAEAPRLPFGQVSMQWINNYAQQLATEIVGVTGKSPITASQGLAGVEGNTAVTRIINTAAGTALVSNNTSAILSRAPIQGVQAMAMSSETFMPPVGQNARLTNTGTGYAYSVDVDGTTVPGYGEVATRDKGFMSILNSPVTTPDELRAGSSFRKHPFLA